MEIREARLVDAYAVKILNLQKQIKDTHLSIQADARTLGTAELQARIIESGALLFRYRNCWLTYDRLRKLATREPVCSAVYLN
jgi:hypothetical protein